MHSLVSYTSYNRTQKKKECQQMIKKIKWRSKYTEQQICESNDIVHIV